MHNRMLKKCGSNEQLKKYIETDNIALAKPQNLC